MCHLLGALETPSYDVTSAECDDMFGVGEDVASDAIQTDAERVNNLPAQSVPNLDQSILQSHHCQTFGVVELEHVHNPPHTLPYELQRGGEGGEQWEEEGS